MQQQNVDQKKPSRSFAQKKSSVSLQNNSKAGFVIRISLMLFALISSMAGIAIAQDESSNMQEWLGVDLFKLIGNADVLGKFSLCILAVFSILSWMVIVYKYLHLRQAIRQTDQFVDLCNQGSGDLKEAFKHASSFPDSPLAQVLREGYLELEVENWYLEGYNIDNQARTELAKVGMERVFERTISSEITHLESKLIFLATTSSVCPFIGLFGTVWGIMGSFQSLTNTGSVALSSLAPGLSTALITTVGGLFCAIPASVMYNFLANNVRILIARMDAFSLELSNVIQKKIIKQSIQ
jgi:biopolymer transport protein TolQ